MISGSARAAARAGRCRAVDATGHPVLNSVPRPRDLGGPGGPANEAGAGLPSSATLPPAAQFAAHNP